jgi:alkylhydroperoxidase family enzyme
LPEQPHDEWSTAALASAEAVTRLSDGHVSDAVFDVARAAFTEAELVALTLAVTTINTWNRFQYRVQDRARQPGAHAAAPA